MESLSPLLGRIPFIVADTLSVKFDASCVSFLDGDKRRRICFRDEAGLSYTVKLGRQGLFLRVKIERHMRSMHSCDILTSVTIPLPLLYYRWDYLGWPNLEQAQIDLLQFSSSENSA